MKLRTKCNTCGALLLDGELIGTCLLDNPEECDNWEHQLKTENAQELNFHNMLDDYTYTD